jgi:large subunit ribosomal protein L17
MRKRKPARKLGRTASHRRATLANLSTQLILHKRITTTEAKAKEMRKVVEKLITRAKEGTVHAQREVFKFIRDKEAIKTLFADVANKTSARNGGYTRVIKLPPRYGDAAKMALIELVDYSEAVTETKPKKQDRSKRVRGSKKTDETQAATQEVKKPRARAKKTDADSGASSSEEAAS